MILRTALYHEHLNSGARLVDFAGWEMPLHYGSQLAEHHQVRSDAGIFDVSHMAVVDIEGADAKNYLRYVLANDVAKLIPGKALYSCMLNQNGGIMDDLMVYEIQDDFYRMVVNAGTRNKDLAWLRQQASAFKVQVKERSDLAIIAVQGPNARAKLEQVLPPEQANAVRGLKPFHAIASGGLFIARTGYTGEDGVEVILPVAKAANFWQSLLGADCKPCGLGARDTLRLEAGLNLYGADMDETTTPLESNLAWTVAWDGERQFIGRNALESQRQMGVKFALVGLVLTERGVLRNHQKVLRDQQQEVGEITSGGFSPTLGCAIALARVAAAPAAGYFVAIRGKLLPVKTVKPPFVRHGKKIFQEVFK